jgi:hypothetical protein
MITELGIVAGEIWHYLDEHGKSKLTDICQSIDRMRDIALMSVGWLAREGHVLVEKENDNYWITLRK